MQTCESSCDVQSMHAHTMDDCQHRRFAFIVVNEAYEEIPKLSTCITGAQRIAEKLKSFDFQVFEDRILENTTTEDIKRSFLSWTSTLPDNATVFVYVAGHGKEFEDDYLLPINFKFEDEQYLVPENYEQRQDDVGPEADDHFVRFKQKTAYEILSGLVGSEMCIRDRRISADMRVIL